MPQELHAPHVLDCTGEELDAVISNTHTHDNKADLDAIGTAALRDVGTEIGNVVLVEDVANALEDKVDKVTGKGLSTEDYTTAEKTKLAGIEAGATNYVHPATHPSTMITGLGTAATRNVGVSEGDVPELAANGKLAVERIPNLTLAKIVDAGTAALCNAGTSAGNVPTLGTDGKLPMTLIDAGGGETLDVVLTRLDDKCLDLGQDVQYALDEITSIKSTYVTETGYATASKGGVVKSSTAADKVKVETDGTMSLNTVSGAKVSGAVASATSATTATTASKVSNKLTAGSKTFDGSAAVTLTAADLGALTSIPDEYVTETEYATGGKGGVVKSSTAANKVHVETDGTMTLSALETHLSVSGDVVDADYDIVAGPVLNENNIALTLKTVPITKGGTGATTAAQALANLGITYGTEDLTPGVSPLPSGTIYIVYE